MEKNIRYQIVVYCTKCGKELTRSKIFDSRKELTKAWDIAILAAPACLPKCPCNTTKGLNIDLDHKVAIIKDSGEEIVNPTAVLKKSKSK